MKVVLKVLAGVVVLALVLAISAYAWASFASDRILSRTLEAHSVDFAIPFPLDAQEIESLGLSEAEAAELALERAVERGRHLVEARYGCAECHGEDFGGGVMVDAFPIGSLLGPNLTEGDGSRTLGYTPTDWDWSVRHGILPDGRPSVMPAEDFQLMSDQELSDIVAYIRSRPPVSNTVPERSLGPLGRFLVATGELPMSADRIGSHTLAHPEYPPVAAVSVEFGRHVTGVCMGCHGTNLAGGPIPGGDPSWPPAMNLTPHADALGGWGYEDFARALREGTRPNGEPLREPMTLVLPYALRMTDVELQAMWSYLQSVPPVAPES